MTQVRGDAGCCRGDGWSHVRQHRSPQHRILGLRMEESSQTMTPASANRLTASFTGQREQEDERSAVCRLSLILVGHLRGSAKLNRPVQRES